MESLLIVGVVGGNLTVNKTSNTTVTLNPYPNGIEGFIMWTIPILNVLLNTVVFIIVPRIKTIQPGTRMGMLSLATSDFGMGIFLLINHVYMAAYTHYQVDKTQPLCVAIGIGVSISYGTSMMGLAFLGVDRLLKMVFPLRYPLIMTTRNTRIIIVIIWIVISGLMFLNFRSESASQIHYYEHVFLCNNNWVGDLTYNLVFAFFTQVVPTFTCMASFTVIFCIATRRKMLQTQASSSQSKRDLRIFRTLAIMTLGFYIAMTPYIATVAIPELAYGHTLHPITDFISCWFVASNSFWNAIIYMLTMRSFQKALRDTVKDVKRLVTCTCSKPEVTLTPTANGADTNSNNINSNSENNLTICTTVS